MTSLASLDKPTRALLGIALIDSLLALSLGVPEDETTRDLIKAAVKAARDREMPHEVIGPLGIVFREGFLRGYREISYKAPKAVEIHLSFPEPLNPEKTLRLFDYAYRLGRNGGRFFAFKALPETKLRIVSGSRCWSCARATSLPISAEVLANDFQALANGAKPPLSFPPYHPFCSCLVSR